MKSLVRKFLFSLGYELRHRAADPVISEALSQLALTAHLHDSLRVHQPELMTNVGANRGQFARQIRSLGYAGPILSIEPQLALAGQLREQALASSGAWHVVAGAAGEREGKLGLTVYSDDTFSSFHQPIPAARAGFGGLLAPIAQTRVPVRPFYDWVKGSPFAASRRIFLKTAPQGHDLAVLAGASRVLRSRLRKTFKTLVDR